MFINIDTNNDYFFDPIEDGFFKPSYFNVDKLENILGYIAFSVNEGDIKGKIKDDNGNVIGEWQL